MPDKNKKESRGLARIRNGIRARLQVGESALRYGICSLFPRLDKRESWVICERGTDARDNGYGLYRYLVENHPELRVHYLITPDSPDRPKVEAHAVDFGSWKNYRVVAKADKIISTHCYTALPVKNEKLWRKLGIARRFYFLQHGITTARLPYLFGDKTKMRLFCCAAIPEYDYVRRNFLHPEQVVRCTGLARYDYLLPFTCKRQILVMPTWRRYLQSEEQLLQSEYFRAWKGLMESERLQRWLAETGTQLIFYPHYEMQPWLTWFSTGNDNVILADFQYYDVQQLLKESLLLVTDYSSVCFDFAYMKKPAVYFQFDTEQYHAQHYRTGYFRYEGEGFGPVVQTVEQVVDEILARGEAQFAMEPRYSGRVDAFFAHRDRDNCRRIYQAITEQ